MPARTRRSAFARCERCRLPASRGAPRSAERVRPRRPSILRFRPSPRQGPRVPSSDRRRPNAARASVTMHAMRKGFRIAAAAAGARVRPRLRGPRRPAADDAPRARARSAGQRAAASSAIAIDLQTGETVFARNPDTPLAPASNEKLTGHLRSAVRARRGVPLQDGCARRRRAGRLDLARHDLPEGLRRPDAHVTASRAPRSPAQGRRDHAASTGACSATSRGSTLAALLPAGSRDSSSTSRRPSRRSSSTATSTTTTWHSSPPSQQPDASSNSCAPRESPRAPPGSAVRPRAPPSSRRCCRVRSAACSRRWIARATTTPPSSF